MGGLWAAGDQVAWKGQHPEGAPGSYGPVPGGMKRETDAKGASESPQGL